MPDTPQRLVAALRGYRSEAVFNPWGQQCEMDAVRHAAAARRRRLIAHLSVRQVRLVLVGEAAGYQGCRYSGIPFTSERLLLEDAIPRAASLGQRRISSRPRPWSEPSASIVWRTLHATGHAQHTVLCNAFPWHPQGKRGAHSNRRPSEAERRDGLAWLERLLALYPRAHVGAVGRSAERSLDELGVRYSGLRHPAYGGATEFARGVRTLGN